MKAPSKLKHHFGDIIKKEDIFKDVRGIANDSSILNVAMVDALADVPMFTPAQQLSNC